MRKKIMYRPYQILRVFHFRMKSLSLVHQILHSGWTCLRGCSRPGILPC
ncbi:hypothetical protein RJ640_030398 [Escallonia rubra]|uniref:Uncharacterized protein n=1 Tax=Escallonia rubra TaxID=112253 RepID=A0AA88QFS5_9ASTE|nr:hypothetical protein RJ640_030398 [Escallonia rubra]